ncbi:hypothetical protein A5819_002370 [Enterococcus sp. 7E2_DIV0204]|uniref:hypothetical protein n=1 Tax=unclassified Enterococcus TaxID=2608891 RepID=UPI000A32B9C8|nr:MULTISPECIES: hypothetical protein [unclassified Enterococcus]OTN89872.1 hypothetical protein A5819_002370 [Enterococcus sp. 7E2_DIV0204]OTP52328.1 hypothetical protein A5884_001529 [Enterococcus sp. 7D2_DIV0200]
MKEYIYKKYSAVIEQESDAAKVIEVIKKRDVSIKYPTNTSMTKINLCHAKGKADKYEFTNIISNNPILNLTIKKNEKEAVDQLWQDYIHYGMNK